MSVIIKLAMLLPLMALVLTKNTKKENSEGKEIFVNLTKNWVLKCTETADGDECLGVRYAK
eukprot:Awhi_evm1s463